MEGVDAGCTDAVGPGAAATPCSKASGASLSSAETTSAPALKRRSSSGSSVAPARFSGACAGWAVGVPGSVPGMNFGTGPLDADADADADAVPEADAAAHAPVLHLSDWLGGWRRNAAGERGRILLESSGLVRKGAYRRDRLIPFWIAHLAGHLGGEALTTVIVSKAGTVTLPRLTPPQVRSYWGALLAAWREGMTRPLPLAVKTGFVWLEKGGTAHTAATVSADGTDGTDGTSSATDDTRTDDTNAGAAREAARDCYEMHDPDYGRYGELESNPYLLRAYPSFDALWSDGEFAALAERLLRPILDHVGARAAARQRASTTPEGSDTP